MHRRAAALALSLALVIPLAPAHAAGPAPTQGPEPTADPGPTPWPAASDEPLSGDGEPGPEATPTATASPTDAPPDATAAPAEGPLAPQRAGGLDATGRYLVLLRDGANVEVVTGHAGRAQGVRADRTFHHATRGFAAALTPGQVAALRADPDVVAVVPDEIVTVAAQYTPLGVRRIGGLRSPAAKIDGIDERVDADVAIVDTGIDPTHPDLNVAGGYNCSTSDPTLWRDVQNHGTHVAGTVGAIDNGNGVVGVAPGVRLWAVKILNDEGYGLLSWYVCGLDWIAAQRDPANKSRPLFEAVNMSVAKSGRDDRTCGSTSGDILHAAICRLVGSGVTVVAAAGNNTNTASLLVPAAYDEVITVSALADTDGRPGGLGTDLCYSWGTYDRDDVLASFSNYGWDVDLIAPGKCIWSTLPGNRYGYSSGTSMAAPHVTGAVALYKATRPLATPAEVKAALQALGTHDWDLTSDRDAYPEKLLDVSRIVALGDYGVVAPSPADPVLETGGVLAVPVTVARSEGFFEDVTLSVAAPAGFVASLGTTRLSGASATDTTLTISVPKATRPGTYQVVVTGRNWDRTRTATVTVTVEGDVPTASAPLLAATTGRTFNTTSLTVTASWAPATDPTSAIAGYEAQWRVDGGTWGGTVALASGTRTVSRIAATGRTYAVRVRARDAAGNWSPWAAAAPYRVLVYQDRSTVIRRAGTWYTYSSTAMSGGTTAWSRSKGASLTATVTGRGFALVMPKGPTRGQARVYVDGSLIATISLYRSSSLARQVVLSRAWAVEATRTVRVVVVGTAGRPRIDLDAIVVLR